MKRVHYEETRLFVHYEETCLFYEETCLRFINDRNYSFSRQKWYIICIKNIVIPFRNEETFYSSRVYDTSTELDLSYTESSLCFNTKGSY